jgi:hypothetical protein
MLGCGPKINVELHKNFFQDFFQSRFKNNGVKCIFPMSTFLKTCGDQNSIKIENHMRWPHIHYKKTRYMGITTWNWWNFIQA